MEKVTIQFQSNEAAPVITDYGAALCEILDSPDSPVFFGCKTGNCGTCLIELDEASFRTLPEPNETEKEMLDTLASDKPFARLACQLTATTDMTIRYVN